jgi:hypothetical protein
MTDTPTNETIPCMTEEFTIKPLEWKLTKHGDREATSPLGTVWIAPVNGCAYQWAVGHVRRASISPTLEAAKSAAEACYRNRMMEGLVPVTPNIAAPKSSRPHEAADEPNARARDTGAARSSAAGTVPVSRAGGRQGMTTVAALFVETNGCYFGLPNVDPWDKDRDARTYAGPHPVVAHPPCQRWGKLGNVNWHRWGGVHNMPANDGGCFVTAFHAVKLWGGVLEHPAHSYAWDWLNLLKPHGKGWSRSMDGYWVCEVWQSAYGHAANKATWLLYFGDVAPPELDWSRPVGSHQVGFQDQRGKEANKPTLRPKAAAATPVAFRDELIRIATQSKTSVNCKPEEK